VSEIIQGSAQDPCGCGPAAIPTATISNRPGLDRLSYRAGTHGSFLRRMLAALPIQNLPSASAVRPLTALTTRAPDDLAVALLDAWATTGDVLTFYQERIANEGFLRTATERRSVLELARTIGYELRPGVAATAYLAFNVDGSPTSPPRVQIVAGTRIESLPAPRMLPQTFETGADFTARAAWNELRPRMTVPQVLTLKAKDSSNGPVAYQLAQTVVFLSGKVSGITVGSMLLFVGPDPNDPTKVATSQESVTKVVFEDQFQRTRVELSFTDATVPDPPVYVVPVVFAVAPAVTLPLTATTVETVVVKQDWHESDLHALVQTQGWDEDTVVKHVGRGGGGGGGRIADHVVIHLESPLKKKPTAGQAPSAAVEFGLYGFAVKTGPFGSSAPPYRSVSKDAKSGDYVWFNNWDDTFPITKKSDTTAPTAGTTVPLPPIKNWDDADFFFDREVAQVQPGTWIVLEDPTNDSPFRVIDRLDRSVADFGMSGRATGVRVTKPDGKGHGNLDGFTVRSTTIRAGSVKLDLAELPILAPIGKGTPEKSRVTLGGMVTGLQVGQPVIINGERFDLDGVTVSEVTFLQDIIHSKGFTTLKFDPLQYTYKRESVTINANVVAATHGETVPREVLGGGDGSQPNQRFILKKPPLTYVPASNPSGATSTLQVQVNGVTWDEAPSLFGLDHRDQRYIVRIDNDAKPTVIFGDGRQGARPPSGTENVVARYRSGIGSSGLVAAGSLTLLQTRPLGVRGVTNPVAADGAADPERLDGARQNAPNTVLTLDRVVSLQDFEAFARGFAGIGKAQAVPFWIGETHLVHVTVAGLNGSVIKPTSSTYKDLVSAILGAGDPVQAFQVDPHQALLFNVTARIVVGPQHDPTAVLDAVSAAIVDTYSFIHRDFGQTVTAAEVVTTIQSTPGVVATDVVQLYRMDDATGPQQTVPNEFLTADRAHLAGDAIVPGQLLLVNRAGITITATGSLA
jgi:hypothetical protein